jgi:hypothetical protein
MLFAGGIIALVVTALVGWWGRPMSGVVSPRIEGWDFYFSSALFLLGLATVTLLVLGIAKS